MSLLKISLSLLFIYFIGCEPAVVFRVPQPTGLESRNTFDPLYRGKFLCDSDSTFVYVKSNCVFKEREVIVKTSLESLDSIPGARIENEMLYIEETDLYFPYKMEGDLLTANVLMRDTLFKVNPGVLKYYRGHHILNKPEAKEKWEVWVLSLDHYYNISLSKAELPEDINKLEYITRVEDLSTENYPQIRLNPSIVEFKEILESNLLFRECDYYIRAERPTEI